MKIIKRLFWRLGYYLSEINNRSGLRLCFKSFHRVPEGQGLYRGTCYSHTPGCHFE